MVYITYTSYKLSVIWLSYLTFSWRRPLSYRNQSIDLRRKSMDWFLYDTASVMKGLKIHSWAKYQRRIYDCCNIQHGALCGNNYYRLWILLLRWHKTILFENMTINSFLLQCASSHFVRNFAFCNKKPDEFDN